MNRAIVSICAAVAALSYAAAQSRVEVARERLCESLGRSGSGIVPGHVVVKLRPQIVDLMQANPTYGLSVAATLLPSGSFVSRIADTGWTLWRVPDSTDVEALAKSVLRDERVLAAEPDFAVHALLQTPNDPDYQVNGQRTYETDPNYIIDNGTGSAQPFLRLWHLDDTNALAGFAVYPNTWYTASTHPKNGPIIAMIDSGCEMDHPDFINAGGTGTDVSRGGQFLRSISARFQNGAPVSGSVPQDGNGHGTHTTGLALAAGNNGSYTSHGVIGTGYACDGIILQVLDAQGSGSDTDVAAAIVYAAQHNADVINLSLGESQGFSRLLQDAVTYAFQRGCIVVCAGNEANGGGNLPPNYPAQCSGALAITANGPNQLIASYSGSGNYICLAAPGGDVITAGDSSWAVVNLVFSTITHDPNAYLNATGQLIPPYVTDYAYLNGTSMATPIVSGAAGLYLASNHQRANSGYSNIATMQALERAAMGGTIGGGWEPVQGYGSLDIEGSLRNVDARGATLGSISGNVNYQGSIVHGASVAATQIGGSNHYLATSQIDGSYRFEPMMSGTYTVTATYFGGSQSKLLVVRGGCDNPAQDFWINGQTGDTTPPTIGFFNPSPILSRVLTFSMWAYDTETGIQSVSYRVGRTRGGNELKGDTSVPIGVRDVKVAGLGIPRHYYITLTVKNGQGLSTVAVISQ